MKPPDPLQFKAYDVELPNIFPFGVVVDFCTFYLSGISLLTSPHSSISNLFVMGGLITCDLSGADPTPTHATESQPRPNQSEYLTSFITDWLRVGAD